MKTSYKRDFANWVKQKNVAVESSSPLTDLKPGDIVTFTNDYGVKFEGREVFGFCEPQDGRCVYFESDSYWFPARIDQLTIEG